MTEARFSRRVVWGLLGFSALAFLLRTPELFAAPRLWAEEGQLYYHFAYLEGPLRGLFFIPTNVGGYFSLSANLPSTLAATFFAVEHAPWVTLAVSYFALFIPVSLILSADSYLMRTSWHRLALFVLFLFGSVHAPEAWLNTINLMSYLGMTSLLILCARGDSSPRWVRGLSYSLLVFAGLSAVYTTFITPLFVLKAFWERSREALIQAGLAVTTALIQVSIFVSLYLSRSIADNKIGGYDVGVSSVASFKFHILETFIPRRNVHELMKTFDLYDIFRGRGAVSASAEDYVIVAIGYALFFALALAWNRNPIRWLLLGAFLSLSLLITLGSMNGLAGGRYAMAPAWAAILLVFSRFAASAEKPTSAISARGRRVMTGCAVLLLLSSLLTGFFTRKKAEYWEYTHDAPVWAEEIAAWRADPHHAIRIWPYPAWQFQLSEREVFRAFQRRVETEMEATVLKTDPPDVARYAVVIDDLPVYSRLILRPNPGSCEEIAYFSLTYQGRRALTSLPKQKIAGSCEPVIWALIKPEGVDFAGARLQIVVRYSGAAPRRDLEGLGEIRIRSRVASFID